jgi:hypothetical protein
MKNNKLTIICLSLLAIGIISSCSAPKQSSMSNMVARMEVKEPIKGVCDNANIIAVLPFPGSGQVSAVAPETEQQITAELNAKVSFLKDKPTYEDKGMVSLIVNCKGELVKCEIDNKTKSPELDSQVVAVFALLKTWTPAKVKNQSVDSVVLYSFTIKNGKITL